MCVSKSMTSTPNIFIWLHFNSILKSLVPNEDCEIALEMIKFVW